MKTAIPSTLALAILLTCGLAPAVGALSFERVGEVLGAGETDQLGWATAAAGDVNGDGYGDVIVGPAIYPSDGYAYVLFGGPDADAVPDVVLTESTATGLLYGLRVAGVGDVNGDGYDDVAVGAPGVLVGDTGAAFVYHGGPDGTDGDTAAEFSITGTVGQHLGIVAAAGDVDNDGLADVAIGGSEPQQGDESGVVVIVFGSGETPLTIDGAPGNQLGSQLTAGDVNYDGYDDVIATGSGIIKVYFGEADPDTTVDLVLTTPDPSGFGFRTRAGDVDGDGIDDIVVGETFVDLVGQTTGRILVYSGGIDVDATADLVIEGWESFLALSQDLDVADVDGDGFGDIIAGTRAERVYVYRGGPSLDDEPDLVIPGDSNDAGFGISVAAVEGFFGDDDVLIGVGADHGGADSQGSLTYVRAYPYRLLAPVGGERWRAGETATVTWRGREPADVWLSTDGGFAWNLLAAAVGGDDENTLEVRAPARLTDEALVRVSYAGVPVGAGTFDVSDAPFHIADAPRVLSWSAGDVSGAPDFSDQDLAVSHDGRTSAVICGSDGAYYASLGAGGWELELLESAGFLQYPSIALGPDGVVHVVYSEEEIPLRYARREDGVWMVETAFNDITRRNSVGIHANGEPYVVFWWDGGPEIQYGRRVGGVWTFEPVEPGVYAEEWISSAISADDVVHVAYAEPFDGEVRYVARDALGWSAGVVIESGGDPRWIDMALTPDERPVVAYQEVASNEVRVARMDALGAWTVEVVANTGQNLQQPLSLAIAPDGTESLAYQDPIPDDLVVWRRADGVWTELDRVTGPVAGHPAMAVDADGNLRILHRDLGRNVVRYRSTAIELATPGFASTWPVGARRRVAVAGEGHVALELTVDAGASWQPLGDLTAPGALDVTVPNLPTRYARVRATRQDPPVGSGEPRLTESVSISEGLFTIDASITLMAFRHVDGENGPVLRWETSPGLDDLRGYDVDALRNGVWETLAHELRDVELEVGDQPPGTRYRLVAVDGLGRRHAVSELATPRPHALAAWPLPMRGDRMTIAFRAAGGLGLEPARTEVGIYDVAGRRVDLLVDALLPEGSHTTTWDGRDAGGRRVGNGIYFVRLATGAGVRTLKVVRMR